MSRGGGRGGSAFAGPTRVILGGLALLALLYLDNSQIEEAASLLPLPERGNKAVHAWIRVWIHSLAQTAPAPRDLRLLESHTFEFLEEERRVQDLLQSFVK